MLAWPGKVSKFSNFSLQTFKGFSSRVITASKGLKFCFNIIAKVHFSYKLKLLVFRNSQFFVHKVMPGIVGITNKIILNILFVISRKINLRAIAAKITSTL